MVELCKRNKNYKQLANQNLYDLLAILYSFPL